MSIRGRPPKPTLVKEKTGNPGGRKLNKSEPTPNGEAVAPAHLSKTARIVWDRAVRGQAAGLYTICDEILLASFCEAEATRVELQTEMAKQPKLVKGSTGQLVVNPLQKAVNDQVRLLKELAADLGFSPRARQGLQVDRPKPKTNKFAAMMGGQLSGAPLQ